MCRIRSGIQISASFQMFANLRMLLHAASRLALGGFSLGGNLREGQYLHLLESKSVLITLVLFINSSPCIYCTVLAVELVSN